MLTTLALCVLAMSIPTTTQAQISIRWESANGPFGGNVRHLSNGRDALFAGTSTGGVFRLRSFSTMWEAASSGFGDDLVIAALYASPTDGTVFATTQRDNGFYVSMDNGTSWGKLSTLSTRARAILQYNSTIFLATNFGVLRSTDGGRSFQQAGSISNPDPTIRTSQVQSLAVCNGILYTAGPAGLYRSSDGGASWTFADLSGVATQIGTPVSNVESVWSDGTTVFAATNAGPVVSVNNGLSWTRRGTKTFGISRVLQTSSTLFALSGNSVWRANSTGENWAEITSVGEQQCLETASSSVYVGGVAGAFRSNDNGGSWVSSSKGITAQRINSVLSFSGATLAGGDFGVYRASGVPFSTQWLASGLDNQAVNALATMRSGSTLVTIAGTNAGVYRSLDTGKTWTNINAGDSMGVLQREQVLSVATDGGIIYAGTSNNGLFRSRDLGQTWQRVGGRIDPIRSMLIAFRRLYIAHGRNIEVSLDSGATWRTVLQGSDCLPVTSLAVRLGTLYAARQLLSCGNSTLAGVYRSVDSGATWSRSSAGLTSLQVTRLFPIGPDLLVGTADAGVFTAQEPIDSLKSWSPLNAGLQANENVLCLGLDNNDTSSSAVRFGTLFIGTASRGIYQSRWNTTSVPQPALPLEGGVFPNPSGGLLIVEARVQPNALATIRIVSMTGTLVLATQERSQGEQLRATLDLSALPAGAYMVEILDGTHRFTSKLVKE
jgi:hypothetical protein